MLFDCAFQVFLEFLNLFGYDLVKNILMGLSRWVETLASMGCDKCLDLGCWFAGKVSELLDAIAILLWSCPYVREFIDHFLFLGLARHFSHESLEKGLFSLGLKMSIKFGFFLLKSVLRKRCPLFAKFFFCIINLEKITVFDVCHTFGFCFLLIALEDSILECFMVDTSLAKATLHLARQ